VLQYYETSEAALSKQEHIFSYLVTSNRVRWYRIIMRTFFKHHRELYHYQLTAQEIRDAVRSTFYADYTQARSF
jgi:hypothetical protein